MDSRFCGECGSRDLHHFINENFRIEHGGRAENVPGLNGWRCRLCGEVEFEPESMDRYAQVSDTLVLEARERQCHEIRRIRKKLGLSQKTASSLTGGGHNAFSRYERGEATPLPAVVNLFKLLDKHPELLDELLPS